MSPQSIGFAFRFLLDASLVTAAGAVAFAAPGVLTVTLFIAYSTWLVEDVFNQTNDNE